MDPLDMHKLWQQAKSTAATPVQSMGTGFVYNLLNDMKPIFILENRHQHSDSLHIRDSLQLIKNSQGLLDISQLTYLLTQATGRIVYVEEDISDASQADPVVLNTLREMTVFQKIYVLRGGFTAFYRDYPFLCVPSNPTDSQLMMARARWPTEILQHVLYIGNVFNAKSGHQCSSLNIKSMMDLCPSPDPTDKYHYLHVPAHNELLNLEELITWIHDAPKPLIIYDANGNTFAPLIAAAYLTFYKNVPSEKALAYVVSKRPDMDPNPTVFLQVQNLGKAGGYKPPALPSIDDLLKKVLRHNS